MSARSRGYQRRLGAHSKSTPNFAAIKEDSPQATWTLPKSNTESKRKRTSPTRRRKPPTFTSGVPSEPVSPDERAASDSSGHSGSFFERNLVPRTTSYSESGSGSSDNEDHDTANGSNTTYASGRPPYGRSQSSLGPSAFAPPFYNRPPTPLPPSPSLISLVRPRHFAFSPSRPATPESSDTEATAATSTYNIRNAFSSISLPAGGTTGTPSATPSTAGLVAQSALSSSGPVPRASPKLPTNEYYGFVLYLGSSVAFFLYLLWSYLPTPFLHQLGIYYYPDRWWSLAVPSWLVMAIVWTYVALASYNTGYLTLGLQSLECLVDEKGRIAVVDARGRIVREERRRKDTEGAGRKQRRKRERREKREREREGARPKGQVVELDWRSVWSEGTDAVLDVPIGGVCEVLYGADRDEVDDEDLAGDGALANG